MALRITDDCIGCAACASECPNQAIDDFGPTCIIDPKLCTECIGYFDEPQCLAVCPVSCVEPDPRHAAVHAVSA